MARTKGGLNTKLHIAVDSHGLPVKMIVTDGNTADCTQAKALVSPHSAQYLMADKAYDTNELLDLCRTKIWKPSSQPNETEPINAPMTKSSTNSGIWWKMRFSSLNNGGVSLRDMPKQPKRLSQNVKSQL